MEFVKETYCQLNLFNIFIKDLAKYLNLINIGIDINGSIICILLYADDLANG